jgi:integrase
MQTHLYRRGAIYYWRRLVPTAFQPILGARDLRASLRTNLPETARSRASRMDAAFDLALEELEQIVRSGQVLPEAVKSRLVRELRQEIIGRADGRRLMAGVRSPQEVDAAVAKALKAQIAVQGLLARNDLARGKAEADRLLTRDGVRLDTSGLEYHQLARDLLVGMSDAFGVVADHEQGLGLTLDSSLPTNAPASSQSNGILTDDQIREDEANRRAPFSVHAQAFLAEKEGPQGWSTGQVDDAMKAFKLFQEFVGDKPIAHYTRADTTFFVNQLARMPVGVGQRHPYIDISASGAIEKADEIEAQQAEQAEIRIKREKIKGADADKLRQDAHVNRLSIGSMIKYRDHCNAVFKHLQAILHVSSKNPFSGIRPKKKKKSDIRDDREKYTDDQIRRIFSSPIWTGCKSAYFFAIAGALIEKNENYWVPIIAALMGMRLEEICQLWLDDIIDVDGIWCIDIWDGPERQLKNGPSARRIPIPDLLIKLGLLEHKEKLRGEGKYRLFPALERCGKKDKRTGLKKLGPSMTRSMGRYFRIHKLADANQLFHSFRHTFASKLDEMDVPIKAINDLMGHLQGGSESSRRYIKRDQLLKLKGYMERVDFGFQLVQIGGEWHFAKADEGHPAGR